MHLLFIKLKLCCPMIVNRSLLLRNIKRKTCARLCCDSRNTAPQLCYQYSTFSEMLSERRAQANRSFLVEASVKSDLSKICEICEKIGPIKACFNYTLADTKEVFLVECDSSEMLKEVLKCCHYPSIPVYSRLLSLSSNNSRKTSKTQLNATAHTIAPKGFESEEEFVCNTVSEQMDCLYQNKRLEDLGTRLRFLICQQFEDSLAGIFPHSEVLPFGSSINGFGVKSCDLDMSLHLLSSNMKNTKSSLCFYGKYPLLNGRMQNQRILETIADSMKMFFPGIGNVHKILKARIPIIAFNHTLTNVECDLSANNLCAVYMSELLYLYGELDPRVRSLVFTVRSWAKASGLTNNFPGAWISNFSLTLMVLFFLQNRPLPVVPSLRALIELADNDDVRIAEDVDCTFQRKFVKIPPTANVEDAGTLLLEFFRFYEKFNFQNRGLSLRTGKSVTKSTGSALYIENPLEPQLNVSANVSFDQVVHLQEVVRSAIWTLESDNLQRKQNPWGIFRLFAKSATTSSNGGHTQKGTWKVKWLYNESDPEYTVTSENPRKAKQTSSLTALNVGLVKRVLKIPISNDASKRTISATNVLEKINLTKGNGKRKSNVRRRNLSDTHNK